MKYFFAFLLMLLVVAPIAQAQDFFASAKGTDFISEVKVYPNPSSTGEFTTEFVLNHKFEGTVNVKVYNLVGREVYREVLNPNNGHFKSAFSLANLSKGVYMLEISMGDKRITRRLSFV